MLVKSIIIILSIFLQSIIIQAGEDQDEDDDDEDDHDDPSDTTPFVCDSLIYCKGKLLHTIQMANLFNDSKHFVDMSMRQDPGMILTKFEELMKKSDNQPPKDKLRTFIKQNFKSDVALESWLPEDLEEEPCLLTVIPDPDKKVFTADIIGLWKKLGRKVTENVIMYPDRHSMIPLAFGFISPGASRYREFYYWDSYFIIDGLLLCDMLDTVKGMIDNMLTMIIKYRFMPNGSRKYYVERSQPPMLPFIVWRYYEETTDIIWLKKFIDYFEIEMQFWINNRKVSVEVNDVKHRVYYYQAESKFPRPEAYYEDMKAASYFKSQEEREQYFSDINTSAESGWDSSSRWIVDAQGGTDANITFSRTTRILPVDLNAYLYGAFRIMARLYFDLENYNKQEFWTKKARELNVAIEKIFWNMEDGIWYDYDLELKQQRRHFYASNLAPLWTKAYRQTPCKKTVQIKRILKYLKTIGVLDMPGGIPSSLKKTNKQWDMPNVWPPLQSIIVSGLYGSNVPKAQEVAKSLADKFLKTTMKGWNEKRGMFQRYDANNLGRPGPGGEYETEKIFAWTCGVALQFINLFYTSE